MKTRLPIFPLFSAAFLFGLACWTHLAAEDSYRPPIAPASNEGQQAIEGFKIPDGFQVELVAAEPLLANPVAFDIDEQGRFYICETFRQQKGVEDNRSHMDWLHDDLAAQTVEDRLAYIKKHLGEKAADYAKEQDRIRLLTDTDGDGKVDESTIYVDGFNDIVDGTGAGVLAHRGDVYYTCIPKLYKFRDSTGDGQTDTREVLSDGYGVRFAFRGHDMHGLTIGPDGRLYFSIGDRGFHVITKEGVKLHHPDTGAVLRCELDGSDLEVFAYGLRNPQELAFDDYGNLFTCDNNSDSGDQARWVHIVEGMDAGWRMYYQYLPDRGPWNREMMWYPHDAPPLEKEGPGGVPKGSVAKDIQPAYIVPPVANVSDGPSGLVHYPGVGLPEKYNGNFFLCDFRGGAGQSGIRAIAVKPKGASFELVKNEQFLWSTLATDVDFGYDGNMYWTDWVNGWNGEGKGRLYRLTNSESEKAAEVAKLFREGFGSTSVEQLVELLGHVDQRVRLAAQFEMVKQNQRAKLIEVAKTDQSELARIHAIWALGQFVRQIPKDMIRKEVHSLRVARNIDVLSESFALQKRLVSEIRRQPAGRRVLDLYEPLKSLISDESPAIRRPAFEVLCRLLSIEDVMMLVNTENITPSAVLGIEEHPHVVAPMWLAFAHNRSLASLVDFSFARQYELVREDPVLLHAAVQVMAANLSSHKALGFAELDRNFLTNSPDKTDLLIRTLALRRNRDPEIATVLNDSEAKIVLEAARAINDVPIEKAQPELAKLAGRPGMSEALLRRVLNANFRLGQQEHAEAVAEVAADASASEAMRVEALEELLMWEAPSPTDRVTGMWRPLEPREAPWMADVLGSKLGGMLSGSRQVRELGIKLAAKYGIQDVGPTLQKLLAEKDQPGEVRAEALKALESLKDATLREQITWAVADADPLVRAEALRILAVLEPEAAIAKLEAAIADGETVEAQKAVDVLAGMKLPAAEDVLLRLMSQLQAGELAEAVQLDVLNAAEKRGSSKLREAIDAFESARPSDDPLAMYSETLQGGHAGRGADIFFGRSEVSCRRCHMIGGSGGNVGPDLSEIGKQKDRRYILESIVKPNAQIAKGFETVLLATDEGKVISGVIREETDDTIQLMDKNGAIIRVPTETIVDRAKGKSSMPEDMMKYLSKSDLRDLVEYLAQQKTPPKKPSGHAE
ncbi:PVC-type heme-binding CxxCH protein [Thalassoroseus pseudoceratinae]|uniref:PVC-type heme-binding CxxCH protein n=1 Tax=Thalassoroseus pseudoceratinae TaxID=2713176 RepID=UPI0014209AF0|nr:PVC-type heme-binding CxxCH protein [Thalassoroseus pseudoceratinae]